MNLPEWAKWLARDADGTLYAFENKPFKSTDIEGWINIKTGCDIIRETDDTFSRVKWEDKEPTEVKIVPEVAGISAEELNRIMNAKAHGYDEVPEVEDKNERMHVDKDGAVITLGEITSISLVDGMRLVENKMENETDTNKDMVNQPNHYIGEYGLEVEDVLRNFIPRYTDPYVGHRVASAIEYLLRSPLKNQRQDIEKAGKNIQQALAYLDMTEEDA